MKVFEEKLNGYSKEVEAFRKKEVYLLEHMFNQFKTDGNERESTRFGDQKRPIL